MSSGPVSARSTGEYDCEASVFSGRAARRARHSAQRARCASTPVRSAGASSPWTNAVNSLRLGRRLVVADRLPDLGVTMIRILVLAQVKDGIRPGRRLRHGAAHVEARLDERIIDDRLVRRSKPEEDEPNADDQHGQDSQNGLLY